MPQVASNNHKPAFSACAAQRRQGCSESCAQRYCKRVRGRGTEADVERYLRRSHLRRTFRLSTTPVSMSLAGSRPYRSQRRDVLSLNQQ
jgi:hypothetical protein